MVVFVYTYPMMRKRRQKEQHGHYYILVNKTATAYSSQPIDALVQAIREKGQYYTIFESESVNELVARAQLACGLRRGASPAPAYMQRRGKVTSLVVAGGDGTVNALAGVAIKANLPLGILPMGKFNNIARSLCESTDYRRAVEKILARNYRAIDTADASGRLVVGSLGLGLIPQIAHQLNERKMPRFSFQWSQLASKAVASVKPKKMLITIDAFRFEVTPTILNVNLLPYSAGLQLSAASLYDDKHAEIIFNVDENEKELTSFVRLVQKKKYYYGSMIRLFRGNTIILKPVKGQEIYLDGEFLDPPDSEIEIHVGEKQLKVYC